VNAQPGLGDTYLAVEDVEPIDSGDKVKIEHKEGEVVLIDFWATWCPPCQAPMQHNVDMIKSNGDKWGKDVRIVGISIDREKAKLQNHVKSKGWDNVEHYYRSGSNCSEVYGVRGVPHVMLLDKSGRIVYKGHPASRKLEEDIETLRAGKALEGDNVYKGIEAEQKDGGSTAE